MLFGGIANEDESVRLAAQAVGRRLVFSGCGERVRDFVRLCQQPVDVLDNGRRGRFDDVHVFELCVFEFGASGWRISLPGGRYPDRRRFGRWADRDIDVLQESSRTDAGHRVSCESWRYFGFYV